MDGDWTWREGGLDAADVVALLALHLDEMRGASPREACHVLPADELSAADIRFFTLRAGETLIGIGALRDHGGGLGELKSMRTHPDALGRGVGKAMLARLVETARAAGMTRLALETGTGPLFAAAHALYRGAGFVETGPFGGYRASPFTRFYARAI